MSGQHPMLLQVGSQFLRAESTSDSASPPQQSTAASSSPDYRHVASPPFALGGLDALQAFSPSPVPQYSSPARWTPTPYSEGSVERDIFSPCPETPPPSLPLPGAPASFREQQQRAALSVERAKLGQVAHMFTKLRGRRKVAFSSPKGAEYVAAPLTEAALGTLADSRPEVPAPFSQAAVSGHVGYIRPVHSTVPEVFVKPQRREQPGVPRHRKTHMAEDVSASLSPVGGGGGGGRHAWSPPTPNLRKRVRLLHDVVEGGARSVLRYEAGEEGVVLRRHYAKGTLEVEMDAGGAVHVAHWCVVPCDPHEEDDFFHSGHVDTPRRPAHSSNPTPLPAPDVGVGVSAGVVGAGVGTPAAAAAAAEDIDIASVHTPDAASLEPPPLTSPETPLSPHQSPMAKRSSLSTHPAGNNKSERRVSFTISSAPVQPLVGELLAPPLTSPDSSLLGTARQAELLPTPSSSASTMPTVMPAEEKASASTSQEGFFSPVSSHSYSEYFLQRVDSKGTFSDSSGSSSHEDEQSLSPSVAPLAVVSNASSRARRRWQFLRRNLHNIRTGMHIRDYHGAVKGHLDRRRFINIAIEARRAQKLQGHVDEVARQTTVAAEAANDEAVSELSVTASASHLSAASSPAPNMPTITLTGATSGTDVDKKKPGYMMKVAFGELLQTEKTYVGHLKLIVEKFVPAVSPFLDSAVNKESRENYAADGARLFANVDYLYKIHKGLLEGIQRHAVQWDTLHDTCSWIIDWELEAHLRAAKAARNSAAFHAYLLPPPPEEERVLIGRRRDIHGLALLISVFKDQVSARGGPEKVFSKLTNNETSGSSDIRKQDFWSFCRKGLLFSHEAAARVFQEVDTDQNGSINKEELYRITSDMLFTRWCKSVMYLGEGHEVFDSLDAERKGAIPIDKFMKFSCGMGFSESEAGTVLSAISQSTTPTQITRKEFCHPLGINVLSNSSDIGELLHLVVPLERSAYTRYANNFSDSIKAHDRLKANAPLFVKACKKVTDSGDTGGLNLGDLLITPIQRMTRYPLILREAIKHIPCKVTHNAPLMERIHSAVHKMNSLNSLVDASVTKRHNDEKLCGLSEKIVFKLSENKNFKLVVDGRRLIKSGPLNVVNSSGVKKSVFFYLFTDVLLYTTKNNQCRHVIDIEQIELLDMEDTNEMKNSWVLKSPKVSFVVSAATKESKEEWAATLLANSDSLRSDNPALVLQPLAPVWTSPTSTSTCTVCEKPFNIFRRKHHCYHCGYLVCRSCSRHKFFLPHIHETAMVQVCTFCFEGLTKEREQLLKARGLLGVNTPSSPSRNPSVTHGFSGTGGAMPEYTHRPHASVSIISASTMNVSEDQGDVPMPTLHGRKPTGSFHAESVDGQPGSPQRNFGTLQDQSKRNVEAYLRSLGGGTTKRKTSLGVADDETLASFAHEDTQTLNNSVHVQMSDLKLHEYHILSLQERLVGRSKPVIIKSGRRLLLSSLLLKKGTRDWTKYRFFLFSDALMYCKEVAFSKLYFKNILPLLHMTVEIIDDVDVQTFWGEGCFKILSTKKSFVVKPTESGPDHVGTEEWVQHIRHAAQQHRISVGSRSGLDGVVAAVRKTEEEGQVCAAPNCTKTLPKLSPRKAAHCTACGGIFCKACIAQSYYTSPGVKGPTCAECFAQLKAATIRHAAEFLHDPQHNPPLYNVATNCYVCKTRFTLFKTKKECWSCCAVVCGDCSPHKSILARLDPYNPMRVCSPCYHTKFGSTAGSPLSGQPSGLDSVISASSHQGDGAESLNSSVRPYIVETVSEMRSEQ